MIPIPRFRSVQQVWKNDAAIEFGPMSEDGVQKVREIDAERMSTAE